MERSSFKDMSCSIAQALEEIGEWWTLLIVRDAMFGVTRFTDFQDRLGIARNVLAARLQRLVEAGVFERVTYDAARNRADYVLTDKGRALWKVASAVREWGDEWIVGKTSPHLVFRHASCGTEISTTPTCTSCHEPVQLSDTTQSLESNSARTRSRTRRPAQSTPTQETRAAAR